MRNTILSHRLWTMCCMGLVTSMSMLFISSCKKGTSVDLSVIPEPKPKFIRDSVYFEINGRTYSAVPDLMGMSSVSNSGYRMKYLTAPEAGMKIYTEYGMTGRGWYATTDSIYFSCGNTYRTADNGVFEVSFSQGFHKRDMNSYGSFYFPVDSRNMLRKGKLSFASDYESNNFKDGVAISFSGYGRTGKPKSAFEVSIADYSQDNSVFEIIKTEQVDKDTYFVEAKFALNLYDNNRAKHRVANGYIKFRLMNRGLFGLFYQ